MIHILFPFRPQPKGRPRFWKGRAVTPPKTRTYERDVKLWVSKYAPKKPLDGPLKITARFILKRPKKPKNDLPAVRPDLDNYLKGLLDALNGLLWHDDAQIVEMHALKLYDEPERLGERIVIVVEEI